ncbi:MAG: GNAT family N-acetyltransferase [Clostridia bacterium]|nr:GNAT family N-acetyltransferase [Clostridia bacterium]MBQ8511682.1 GNAT family N-acetyltransferase [Clostridia bacterium]
MEIRKTTTADLDAVMEILNEARRTIAQLGIDQWQDGYPTADVILDDIAKDRSRVMVKDGEIIGTFAVLDDGESTYDEIHGGHWITGDENRAYIAVHRVAVSVRSRGTGASAELVKYAADTALSLGMKSVRIDTHEGNVVMRRMLEKNGFTHCGTICLENGDPRVAYEKTV